jgi:hypothetical protein
MNRTIWNRQFLIFALDYREAEAPFCQLLLPNHSSKTLRCTMPRIEAFHSRREARKPADQGVYHNNSTCRPGRDINLSSDDRHGTGNYHLCHDCDDRNFSGK